MLSNMDTKFYTSSQQMANDKVERKNNALLKRNNVKDKVNELDWYGGKRFLGLTKNGTPVYVRYKLIKDSLSLQIDFSHKLSALTLPGSVMANDRYSMEYNEKPLISTDAMTRKLKKKRGGEVTIKTLHHLQRLKELVDMKYYKGFIKNKPTKLLFKYIADAIHIQKDITQYNIMEHWPLADSVYFVPESTWKYPDDL